MSFLQRKKKISSDVTFIAVIIFTFNVASSPSHFIFAHKGMNRMSNGVGLLD